MNRRPSPVRLRRRGFTLLELLVVVAIAAILAGLAAPSLGTMFSSNRVQSEASGFVSDLMFARSEAIKRGQGVSVCASADGITCLHTNTWNKGWIVFPDTAACGSAASTSFTPLRVRAAFKGSDTLAAGYPTAATTSCINFNRDGFAGIGVAKTLFMVHTASPSSTTTRCVEVDFAGRVSTQTTSSDSQCT